MKRNENVEFRPNHSDLPKQYNRRDSIKTFKCHCGEGGIWDVNMLRPGGCVGIVG